MANSNPAPVNHGLVSLPTPNTIDVLFYEVRDTRTQVGKTPEYGDVHPNRGRYPDHKLVYISDETPEATRQFFYACDWDKQDQYNAEVSYPYGRTDAPRYTRTYVLPREGYQPVAYNSVDPVHVDAILVGQEMRRIGVKELDSLYIRVQRIYDTILAATDLDGLTVSTADGTEYGVSVSFPYTGGNESGTDYPRVTWRIPIKHSAYIAADDLSACPIVGYTDLKLIEQEYQQDPKSPNTGTWVRSYEIIPSRKNLTSQNDPNWGKVYVISYKDSVNTVPAIGDNFTFASLNDYRVLRVKQGSARGSVVDIQVTALIAAQNRTGTLKESKIVDSLWGTASRYEQWGLSSRDLPVIGTADGPGSGYVLDAKILDDDGVYSNMEVIEVESTTLTIEERLVDVETGLAYTITKLYTISSTQPDVSALDAYGNITEVEKVRHNVWLSTTKPVHLNVGSDNSRTWTESRNMVWPPVLTDFATQEVTEYNVDGVTRRFTVVTYGLQDAFTDKVRCDIQQYWQFSAPAWVTLETYNSEPMQPTPVSIMGLTEPVNIPPCLHAEITYTKGYWIDFEGNADLDVVIDATTPTTWPETFVEHEVQPYRGGYLVRKLTWYRPFTPATTVTVTLTPDP